MRHNRVASDDCPLSNSDIGQNNCTNSDETPIPYLDKGRLGANTISDFPRIALQIERVCSVDNCAVRGDGNT